MMKRILAVLAIASVPLLLMMTVRQTARFESLRSEALRMESLQRDWIEQNRKIQAGISVLSARERVDKAAQGTLGLTPVRPEGILRIKVGEKGSGIDG
jgi:hypothetical protein